MISSDTYNFANLLINQFVVKAGDNDLNFEGVRTIGQIFDVLKKCFKYFFYEKKSSKHQIMLLDL
jgi:hypothetical protein